MFDRTMRFESNLRYGSVDWVPCWFAFVLFNLFVQLVSTNTHSLGPGSALCCQFAYSEVTVSKNGKVKKMLFVITIWVLYKKGGPLNLLT